MKEISFAAKYLHQNRPLSFYGFWFITRRWTRVFAMASVYEPWRHHGGALIRDGNQCGNHAPSALRNWTYATSCPWLIAIWLSCA